MIAAIFLNRDRLVATKVMAVENQVSVFIFYQVNEFCVRRILLRRTVAGKGSLFF